MTVTLEDLLHIALGEFAKLDFVLTEPRDHTLELKHEGEVIDHFTQDASFVVIQTACAYHLIKFHLGGGLN